MDFINDIDLFGDRPQKPKSVNRHKGGRKTPEEKAHEKVLSLLEIWDHYPDEGTSQHILSDGTFDFYSFVGAALTMGKTGFDEFLGTTWLMNVPISTDLISRFDAGQIRKLELIVSQYLKIRTPGAFGILNQGFKERENCKLKQGRIHAKIILLGNYDTGTFLSIEGSSNFTHNPRTEQYIVTNDSKVYNFHKEWINEFRW